MISHIDVPVRRLRVRALNRPPGYLEDVLARGELIEGGKTLRLSYDSHQELLEKYRPVSVAHTCETKECPHCARQAFIPETPASVPKPARVAAREEAAGIQEFRKKFLGPLEQVPAEIAHLRLLMDKRKEEAKSAGCTGCETGKITSEFLAHAWRQWKKLTARP